MKSNLKYRPELDGLRGIAVIAVVLYHFEKILLNSNIFTGGFIGVDIFFVISGYLISNLIFVELKKTNNFSFKNFYIRRAKRILPVLIFIIFFFGVLLNSILIPEKLSFYFKSAISSLLFISNLFFWKTSTVYGAEESINISLLHTWSLSIEEQFYIVFPFVIYISYKFFRNILIYIVVLSLITSFLLANFASMYYPSFNFYSLPTRIWEILFGTVIAYFETFKNLNLNKIKNIKFFQVLFFLLILFFIFFGHDNIYHPSIITLIPILFSIFVICFCRDKNLLLNKLLINKSLVFIGLISYSLYLWHYPLFVFINNLNIDENSSYYAKFIILILSFVISIFSFYLIEKPFRNKSFKKNYIIFVSFFILLIFCFKINTSLKETDYLMKVDTEIKNQSRITNTLPKCFQNLGVDKFCSYNKKKKDQIDLILLGDSTLDKLINNLNARLDKEKYRLVSFAKGGAFYSPLGTYINPKNGKSRFDKNIDKIRSEFLDNKDTKKIIVISYKYRQHLNDNSNIYVSDDFDSDNKISPIDLLIYKKKLFVDGKDKAKKDFKKILYNILKNYKVILIYPYPEYDKDVFQALHVKKKLKDILNIENKRIETSLEKFFDTNTDIINFLDELQNKNLYKIFPHKIFCSSENNKCLFQKNGIPLYYDQIHLTYAGSKLINNEIIKILNKLDLKNEINR